jgi:hypothetical protein
VEQLIEELQQIQQFVLLYPAQGEKGPIAFPRCYRSRPSCNNLSPKPWAWTNSILPNVGKTERRWQVNAKAARYGPAPFTPSKLPLGKGYGPYARWVAYSFPTIQQEAASAWPQRGWSSKIRNCDRIQQRRSEFWTHALSLNRPARRFTMSGASEYNQIPAVTMHPGRSFDRR